MKILALSLLALGPAHAQRIELPNQPLPTKVLTCSLTVVAQVGPRLDGEKDFESGVSLRFQNGGTQMDYEKNEAAMRSEAGDPVMLCLVLIPKNCPPGDKRGRIYTATNLRTFESWTMPDDQHGCGGA